MNIDVFHHGASFDVDAFRLRNARFLIEYHSIHFEVRLSILSYERVVNLRTDGQQLDS